MSYTLGCAFVALLCSATNDFLFKRAGRQGGVSHQLTMVLSVSMLPWVLLYAVATDGIAPSWPAAYAFVGAVSLWAGLYCFSKSLKGGAVSIAAPTFRLAFVVTALLAFLLLGEALTVLKAVGLCCAAASVWLLLAVPQGTDAEITPVGVIQVLLAMLFLGVAFFLFKLALREGVQPTTALVFQAVGQSLAATVAAAFIDRRISASRPALENGVIVGFLQAIGFAAVMEGLSRGEASILVPIIQMSFVVTAIIGLVVLKEKVTQRKVVGLAAAAGAVISLGFAAQR